MTSERVKNALAAIDALIDVNEHVEWSGLRCTDCNRPLRRATDDPRMPWCDECRAVGARATDRLVSEHQRRAGDRARPVTVGVGSDGNVRSIPYRDLSSDEYAEIVGPRETGEWPDA